MSIAQKKVFVGLSGGVDSSVSAGLLKKEGYDVTGVFIKVWQPLDKDGNPLFSCTWKDDRLDAMRVSAKLNIPFQELDLEKDYKKEVVDNMISEYKRGRTPNPDVMCNRFIKFGAFYDWAIKNGADFVATGHYARIVKRKTYNAKPQTLRATRYTLNAGRDSNKDQSYFLWQIRKEQLQRILFPVGGMQKSQVRKLAKKFGLITADKKDSQGLCFMGKIDVKQFLSEYIDLEPGNIVDTDGNIIGRHSGSQLYTIGERIYAREPGANTTPHFIVRKDVKSNTLVATRGKVLNSGSKFVIRDCNWLADIRSGQKAGFRTRYRQSLSRCVINKVSKFVAEIQPDGKIETPAPGQSAVFYQGDTVLGGGIIADN